MSAESLMDGAAAYTSLAEVATADQIDVPEITPTAGYLTVSMITVATLFAEC
ncbi:LxmA leader domain family RiPP [Herbidospora yilanensis]|uniref:LxmA leader domain family RiPP n=1 Tax=Herbidospora yilanensis TaxID=354426 RepID=UPI000A4BDA18|nr:LxmA leader domain family RiPP [Herbidospora yilanensis]